MGGIYGQQKYLYTTKKSEISTKIAGICINSGGIFGGILWKKTLYICQQLRIQGCKDAILILGAGAPGAPDLPDLRPALR